jgi:hypothetical protein
MRHKVRSAVQCSPVKSSPVHIGTLGCCCYCCLEAVWLEGLEAQHGQDLGCQEEGGRDGTLQQVSQRLSLVHLRGPIGVCVGADQSEGQRGKCDCCIKIGECQATEEAVVVVKGGSGAQR